MDSLNLLFLVFTPLLTLAGLYRLWCLINRKFRFKNKTIGFVYISLLILVLLGFIYYGWYYFRCVWPGQCGEGFASGYIAAGVILGILITNVIYILSEVLLFVAVDKRNDDESA